MKMRLLLVAAAIAYPVSTFVVAGVMIRVTLWVYNASGKEVAETVSAATLNGSAATLLWLAFIGGFDMFFTVWQMMQNRQQAAEHQKERESWEEQRKAQEEARKVQVQAQEEARKAQAQSLEEQRQFQQAFLQQLADEREENRRRWEEDRRERDEDRRRREEERREREEERRERERMWTALLQTERERNDFFMARFMELAERVGNGRNNGGNGRGNGGRNSNGNVGDDNSGGNGNNGSGNDNGNGAAPSGAA